MDGRRSEKALNAAFVKSVREQGKPFDGLGPSQRVEPSGPRFQVQRIAIRGKRAELGPGSPALVLLSEAREVALANRKMARAGGGPLQAKRSASAVMTFEEAAREGHRLHAPTWRSGKHGKALPGGAFDQAGPRDPDPDRKTLDQDGRGGPARDRHAAGGLGDPGPANEGEAGAPRARAPLPPETRV
jgi:hypothetical protein